MSTQCGDSKQEDDSRHRRSAMPVAQQCASVQQRNLVLLASRAAPLQTEVSSLHDIRLHDIRLHKAHLRLCLCSAQKAQQRCLKVVLAECCQGS
jgi:hypothetical protein